MTSFAKAVNRMSAPNDNVLIVPSRNVLLTGSAWRGGFRNISHDATGPRPAGRIEKGKEGSHYAAAGRGGDRPKRAACSPAVKAPERQGRQSVGVCSARTAVQPEVGREDEAEGAGDTEPRGLSELRSHAGGGIPGQPTRHSRRTGDGAELDGRRQAVACQQAAHRQDPSVAAAPLPRGRTDSVGHQRARLAGGAWAETVPDRHDRRLQPAVRGSYCTIRRQRTCGCCGATWSGMVGRSAFTPTRLGCL